MSTQVIKIPDIGADSADLIEILVAVGEQVEVDQSLVALESDKASMEVPSPVAGTITALNVAVGDKVSEGMELLEVEVESSDENAASSEEESEAEAQEEVSQSAPQESDSATPIVESEQLFQVPDIGSDEAEVIEVSVAIGDSVDEGDTIVVLETDKASVDVPAEASGTVVALHASEGEKVSQGVDLVTLKVASNATEPEVVVNEEVPASANASEVVEPSGPVSSEPEAKEILVPDMGSDSALVIELCVAVGDRVEEGDTIVVAETDKASVDVPSDFSGEITEIHVAVDAAISQGDKLATVLTEAAASSEPATPAASEKQEPAAAPVSTCLLYTSPSPRDA